MTGPNRTPSQWQRPDGWKYGIDPRVPRWDATGEAVELPEPDVDPVLALLAGVRTDVARVQWQLDRYDPEVDPPRSGGVIAWLAVALIVAAIVIGWLVTRP